MSAAQPMLAAAKKHFEQRKLLGYRSGTDRRVVFAFARHMDGQHKRTPSLESVVAWARATQGTRAQVAARYETVRRFLTRAGFVTRNSVVLPPGYLGMAYLRRSPHIYTEAQVEQLMRVAAASLAPADRLRPWTYRTLFGLLLSTGLRIGEALALDGTDIDWHQGTLFVRRSKTGVSRTIPLHATTLDALREYQMRRDARHPVPRSSAFFLTRLGTRITRDCAESTFRALRAELDWTQRPRPRLHDMRHTFAVRKLLTWIKAGKNVDAEIPALSAYLGHTSPTATYWYLSAVPELMRHIAMGLEKAAVL